MDAAEAGLPDPPTDKPSWIGLADAVFNAQVLEWDDKTCGGGMRWQVYEWGKGFNLKNAISDGNFFQLSARLARYTGNQSYAVWANKVRCILSEKLPIIYTVVMSIKLIHLQMYDWMAQSPLLELQDGAMVVWDNTDTENNCTDVEHHPWSYNAGTMLAGCAYMYNFVLLP